MCISTGIAVAQLDTPPDTRKHRQPSTGTENLAPLFIRYTPKKHSCHARGCIPKIHIQPLTTAAHQHSLHSFIPKRKHATPRQNKKWRCRPACRGPCILQHNTSHHIRQGIPCRYECSDQTHKPAQYSHMRWASILGTAALCSNSIIPTLPQTTCSHMCTFRRRQRCSSKVLLPPLGTHKM